MKRFTLLMAAMICLAISALAQVSENQTLSTSLWKQGIGRCAHYTAYAKGFAKRSDEMLAKFPQGYTLDDLNEIYGNQGQKWEKIYNEFKKNEGRNGSINDLKELVTPQIWNSLSPISPHSSATIPRWLKRHLPNPMSNRAKPLRASKKKVRTRPTQLNRPRPKTGLPLPVPPTCPCGSVSWARCWV